MAVFFVSHADYDIIAFTENSPGTGEGVLPVVVVLLGGQPRTTRRSSRETGRRNRADSPWTSSWSNGYDEVRYSRTNGVVSVAQREFKQCPDGRTLVVLADARRPADTTECIAIADLPVPRMETGGTASFLWRMLTARVLGTTSTHEQWEEHLTRVPAVQAFLSGAQSRTRTQE